MSKQIKLTGSDGKEYTLEYTRRSVETMERQGFVITQLNEMPMIRIRELFAGAFLANHRYIKPTVVDDLYDRTRNKQELIPKLIGMYQETYSTLVDEPSEDDSGNVEWTEV